MEESIVGELIAFAKLLGAAFLGGVIGWERERRLRPAGLRTHILLSAAAALFMVLAQAIAAEQSDEASRRLDPTRALEAIATGVSFIGAGTIFSRRGENGSGQVRGLTTAAGLLATAGVGTAMGLGRVGIAVGTTALIVVVLVGVRSVEERAKPSANRGPREDEGEAPD